MLSALIDLYKTADSDVWSAVMKLGLVDMALELCFFVQSTAALGLVSSAIFISLLLAYRSIRFAYTFVRSSLTNKSVTNTDKPDTDKPDTDKPDTDKPDTDKPDTNNRQPDLRSDEAQVAPVVTEDKALMFLFHTVIVWVPLLCIGYYLISELQLQAYVRRLDWYLNYNTFFNWADVSAGKYTDLHNILFDEPDLPFDRFNVADFL